VSLGNRHQDEGPPTHAQERVVSLVAVGKRDHLRGDDIAEIEELRGKVIEPTSGANRAREQRVGSAFEILVHILKVVSELQQDAPFEGEPALLCGQMAVNEEGVGEDRCAAFEATDSK
jgi:hypothetical protein